MKRLLFGVLTSLALAPLAAQQQTDDGRFLVQFKDFRGAAAAVRAAGGTPIVELAPQSAVAAHLPPQALEGLRHNPNVVLIEPDARRYPMAQTTPYGITMVQADQVSDADAANTTICIIDSGYYRDHEDLSPANVSGSSGMGAGNWYEDSCGHGTHVAGTIAALSNTTGVRGVLGSGKIKLWIEKVFDGASCAWSYSSTLVAALNSCRNNTPAGQKLVINMSLGGSLASQVENNAFQSAYDAGVLSVAASGNAGNRTKSYPASYASVISVAAVDSNKTIASFSQQNNQVELAAPGVGVLSTVPFKSSTIAIQGGPTFLGENLDGSARTTASGPLADGGLCTTTNGNWSGSVVLCERGSISFADKVNNVVNSGGRAAVIYNNVDGGFAGTLNGSSTIPAISIARADGLALQPVSPGKFATVDNVGGTGSGYAYYDGTSMATPHVAGVAALIWSKVPTKTNAQIRAALQATAEDLGAPGKDNAYGYGLVRAKNALDYLGGASDPPPPPPPGGIQLSATGYKVKGVNTVDLSWSGLTGASVEVKRNGAVVVTTANDGAHTDSTNQKGAAVYNYQVCETGTSTCSAVVQVVF